MSKRPRGDGAGAVLGEPVSREINRAEQRKCVPPFLLSVYCCAAHELC